MSRTIRAERHWFENTRRWIAQDEAEGRPLTSHAERFQRRPLTADGRFSDTRQKGPARRRAARRVARQGHEVKAAIIEKAWYT